MEDVKPSCLAVIPARGGSKGVPRKNLRDLAGKPLVAHAIGAALGASRVSRVVVSTDDAQIAEVSRAFGAESMARPKEISGDTASSESAVLHVLEQLREGEGYVPDLVMLIQCTSPLTTSADLDGLVGELLSQGADSAFAAVPFFHFLWDRASDGRARGVNHTGSKRKRRQDLEPQFLESGAAYVMRTQPFIEHGDRFAGRVALYATDAERCLEIDDPVDFIKAEAVMRALDTQRIEAALPHEVAALVMDFDGVLTDNGVLVLQNGEEAVICDRGDGMGLGILKALGVPMLILSKEKNTVVRARAAKLGIECLHGIDDKPVALGVWLKQRELDPAQVVYVGNDINDLGCMRMVGCAVAPSDAHPQALAAARIVLTKSGGRGAIRELCDALVRKLNYEHHHAP